MKIEPLGDRGLILRGLPDAAYVWAEALDEAGIPGLIEAYASYETVGIEIDPEVFDAADFERLVIGEAPTGSFLSKIREREHAKKQRSGLRSLSKDSEGPGEEMAFGGTPTLRWSTRVHEIPVCYEFGPDLTDVAGSLGLAPSRIVELHSGAEYLCRAVGFCPGFGYLSGVAPELTGLPRLAAPRMRVKPGSVGLTGAQTGVYPLPRPGGWRLIGRTPLTLVDVEDGYFPIRAGNRVRFVSIGESDFVRLEGERL